MWCVPKGWASGFAVQVARGKGASGHSHLHFFSCLCTQISPQKTVGVQSSENQEFLFPCFLVFIRDAVSIFSHH